MEVQTHFRLRGHLATVHTRVLLRGTGDLEDPLLRPGRVSRREAVVGRVGEHADREDLQVPLTHP